MTLVLREVQDSGPLNSTAWVHLYMELFQTVNTTELCDLQLAESADVELQMQRANCKLDVDFRLHRARAPKPLHCSMVNGIPQF